MFNLIQAKNTGWILAERAIAALGLFFVTTEIAKYVSPTVFGAMAISGSIVSVIVALSWFGLQDVLFRKLSISENVGARLIFESLFVRVFLCFFFGFFAWLWIDLTYGNLALPFFLAAMVAAVFGLWDVAGLINTVRLRSRINAITNSVGLTAALLLRTLIVQLELDPIFFVVPILVISVVPVMLRIYIAWAKNDSYLGFYGFSRTINSFGCRFARIYLSCGKSLFISNFCTLLYFQIPGWVLVVSFKDEYATFMLAQAFGVAWSFIPAAFSSSFLPMYFRAAGESEEAVSVRWLRSVAVVSILCCFGIFLVMNIFADFLFSRFYSDAASLSLFFSIHTFFNSLGSVFNRIILSSGGYKFLAWKGKMLLAISILASILIVPFFGAFGACFCIVLCEFVSLTVLNYNFKTINLFTRQLKFLGIAQHRA